ncbi:hypothetical protein [Modestobacter sp. Leaf380]|uniref:hypothetical protein n=1 Tax=Modestobacter sp. Leaf380 TaxID=1736356 RepID=UPI0012FC9435|nr:hypothetical protein [Modestobacter sp. Leaf380]
MSRVRTAVLPATVLPATVLLVTVLLGGTACTQQVSGSASPGATTAAATSAPPSTPVPTPSPTAAPAPATPTAPAQRLDAGPVADGAAATVSGTGPATVTYGVGAFALVTALDCTACTADGVLTEPGRSTPLVGGVAPWSGQGLTNVTDDGTVAGELWVLAQGPWTLTLSSWNDLPPTHGPQTVTGSAVIRLADAAPVFRFDWAPAAPGDELWARAYSNPAPEEMRVFGNTEAYSTVVETPMPGVLAVRTSGTWTVTPGG